MADGGLDDILITLNIIGTSKLERLRALARRLKKLTVTTDNLSVIEGLASAFSGEAKQLHVMVECDTGAGRCGVQSPGEAVDLAKTIVEQRGLNFSGLITYPKPGSAKNAAAFMQTAVSQLGKLNIVCPVVSTGGTPDMWVPRHMTFLPNTESVLISIMIVL